MKMITPILTVDAGTIDEIIAIIGVLSAKAIYW
jgi:hypothetical protein